MPGTLNLNAFIVGGSLAGSYINYNASGKYLKWDQGWLLKYVDLWITNQLFTGIQCMLSFLILCRTTPAYVLVFSTKDGKLSTAELERGSLEHCSNYCVSANEYISGVL